jgi:hypothetical protein
MFSKSKPIKIRSTSEIWTTSKNEQTQNPNKSTDKNLNLINSNFEQIQNNNIKVFFPSKFGRLNMNTIRNKRKPK